MSRRSRWFLGLLGLMLLGAACNFTEDLDALEAEAEAKRAGSLPDASPQCETYCELAMTACVTSATRIFDTEAECFTACADYVSNGIDGETGGDTVQCRIYHLTAARDVDPITHCPHAAPDGGGICIGPSPCGSYCGAMQEVCDDFELFEGPDTRQSCIDACLAYPDTGIDGDETGDTYDCRQRAAQAARNDPAMFCPQAAPDGGGVCVGGSRSQCDLYCELAALNCTGENALYSSNAACQAACRDFPVNGTTDDASGDTLQCRTYHVGVAGGAPVAENAPLHCPHAGVDGAEVCVGEPPVREK